MKLFFTFLLLGFTGFIYSQTLIWSEDFENIGSTWTLNQESGPSDPTDSNLWVVSDAEGGVAPPNCGAGNNGNKTLHVSCQGSFCLGTGALYNAGGLALFGIFVDTDKRAFMNTGINTIGEAGLELKFDWIGVGQASQDYAVLEYSIDGGTNWIEIWTQYQGTVCGSGQGQWKEESVTLPSSTENINDLRFAFRWRNNDDGAGADPSFAVNDLRLFADSDSPTPQDPPVADFSASSTLICAGECINFTDLSTGDDITSWAWSFPGANITTSTNQNPTNICYSTPGTYNVTLTVTNDGGSDDKTISIIVDDCSEPEDPPTADFQASSTNICADDCINFTDLSTGDNITSWAWSFPGANTTTSTSQNPTNICYPNPGTYNVTLTVTNANGSDEKTISITVNDCGDNPIIAPTANFTASSTNICADDCISFTDQSTGSDITSWNWEFEGANITSSTDQNPTNICYSTPGTYNATLTVTNSVGSDTYTIQITVQDCNDGDPPIAGFTTNSTTICDHECIDFMDASLGNPTSWYWTFENATPSSSTQQNPTNICFHGPGNHQVTLMVSNANGMDEVFSTIIVLAAPNITAIGDTVIQVGESAPLEVIEMDNGQLFWEPPTGLSCTNCPNPIASPEVTTTYYASVMDNNGCIGRDTVIVVVKYPNIIDVPQAFSPNGDGFNDILKPLGYNIIEVDFRIYNRFGQLMFSTTDPNEGWDGTLNGKELNQGVFFWTLEYRLGDGTGGSKSGNVTLFK